jgi:hypothetical protein
MNTDNPIPMPSTPFTSFVTPLGTHVQEHIDGSLLSNTGMAVSEPQLARHAAAKSAEDVPLHDRGLDWDITELCLFFLLITMAVIMWRANI